MGPRTTFTSSDCLLGASGTDRFVYGMAFGATGETVAELCFNTGNGPAIRIIHGPIPSYAGEIVDGFTSFTLQHRHHPED